jgi:hypothetical protein
LSLDVVIGERLSVHKLLSFKEEPLLVLNLCLQIANLVSKLHPVPVPDGLASSRECLDGNLHAATRTEVVNKVQGRMMLNLVKAKFALFIKSAAVELDGSTWSAMVLLVRVCTLI